MELYKNVIAILKDYLCLYKTSKPKRSLVDNNVSWPGVCGACGMESLKLRWREDATDIYRSYTKCDTCGHKHDLPTMNAKIETINAMIDSYPAAKF